MVFCNLKGHCDVCKACYGHNPYFSRWFSAIKKMNGLTKVKLRHNPYFSRWFSAIAAKIS